jgi:hypothetical protein
MGMTELAALGLCTLRRFPLLNQTLHQLTARILHGTGLRVRAQLIRGHHGLKVINHGHFVVTREGLI